MDKRELRFEVLNKDKLCEKIFVDFGTGEIKSEVFTNYVHEQVFGKREHTIEMVDEFFEERIFDRNRPDIKDILEHLGVKEYDPEAICRVTHGRTLDDFTWIRFDDEKLEWKDVEHYYESN